MRNLILTLVAALIIVIPPTVTHAAVSQKDSAVFIQVPDSMRARIVDVLAGKAVIIDKNRISATPADSVKLTKSVVLVKTPQTAIPDSIDPEIMTQPNLGRFDRGLFSYLFIPKGQWHFGVTASYGEFSSQDLQMLDMLTDFDFTGHTFSVKPYISYFIANNISLGLRLGYTDSKGTLGSMAVDFDDDLNFDIKDVMYRNESYTAAVAFRQYIGLARRGRFGVFNEIELSFSSGDSDFKRSIGGEPKLTHTTYMESRLSFSPGLCVFIMKNVSFNISFAVVGFYLRNEKQWVNEQKTGNRFSSGANFRFNLFNINFGIGIHI